MFSCENITSNRVKFIIIHGMIGLHMIHVQYKLKYKLEHIITKIQKRLPVGHFKRIIPKIERILHIAVVCNPK